MAQIIRNTSFYYVKAEDLDRLWKHGLSDLVIPKNMQEIFKDTVSEMAQAYWFGRETTMDQRRQETKTRLLMFSDKDGRPDEASPLHSEVLCAPPGEEAKWSLCSLINWVVQFIRSFLAKLCFYIPK